MSTVARRYRFAAARPAGLFGAVPLTMVVTLAAGVIAAWGAVLAGAPLPVVMAPLVIAVTVGFVRVGGRPVHTVLPHVTTWAVRRATGGTRWYRPVQLWGTHGGMAALPAALHGLELFDVPDPNPGREGGGVVGVIRDRRAGTLTAVLQVAGDGQFALADRQTQDTKVDLWGLALAGFCRERGPVTRVTWRDWTSPTAIDDHAAHVRTRVDTEPANAATVSYLALVDEISPSSVRHQILVDVTVDCRLVRRRRTGAGFDAAVGVLVEELGLFAARLEHAGLDVGAPLASAAIVEATRVRSDPGLVRLIPTLARSLAAAAGLAPVEFGPVAVDERWDHVRVDGAVHRSYWFARWPRREVPAGWLDPFLFGIGATRTVTVVFEPYPPSRSDRDIDRETVTRETNAEDRARRGFRIRASDRTAARDVTRRETELNDGFAELAYVGLLTITAPTIEELDQIGGGVEQTAAQAGIELHPLYGRHANGWVSSLPLGRTVANRLARR